MLRIVLFAATNVAILVVLSVVARIFGLDQMVNQSGGINFTALLVFSAVIGMAGSFVSLLMSKFMAKRSVGARVIETPTSEAEMWLVQTVERLADQAGIGVPEIAVYDSPTVNAFATGARRDAALVAVSTGLMRSMKRNEVEAVLGHEIAHVANGDMITLTLIQGVVNTFVIFLSRIAGYIVDGLINRGASRGHGIGFFVTSIFAQIVLGFLASMIVAWFSRYREYRADEGGARYAGRGNMIAALQRLKQGARQEALPENMAAFGISGGLTRGLAHLFATHPPLDQRIEALASSGTLGE